VSAYTEINRYGFIHGAAHVERIGEGPKGHVAIHISGGKGKWIQVTVSPKGHLIRVHDQDGYELVAGGKK
jgi:hypothetical protein